MLYKYANIPERKTRCDWATGIRPLPVEDYTETEREIPICDNPNNQYIGPPCKIWMKATPIPLSTSVWEIAMKTTIRTIIH
jgi:5-methylcytosine-specific restriction endonuclease McrA